MQQREKNKILAEVIEVKKKIADAFHHICNIKKSICSKLGNIWLTDIFSHRHTGKQLCPTKRIVSS